jgi:amphi-Trp domain-containing protein
MAAGNEFKHESVEDAESIVRYLRALTDGLEKGYLEFMNGKEGLVLEPRGLLQLEVRARKKGDRRKVSFKFEWREAAPEETEEEKPLRIKSESGA